MTYEQLDQGNALRKEIQKNERLFEFFQSQIEVDEPIYALTTFFNRHSNQEEKEDLARLLLRFAADQYRERSTEAREELRAL